MNKKKLITIILTLVLLFSFFIYYDNNIINRENLKNENIEYEEFVGVITDINIYKNQKIINLTKDGISKNFKLSMNHKIEDSSGLERNINNLNINSMVKIYANSNLVNKIEVFKHPQIPIIQKHKNPSL